jgi:hypothetical protein
MSWRPTQSSVSSCAALLQVVQSPEIAFSAAVAWYTSLSRSHCRSSSSSRRRDASLGTDATSPIACSRLSSIPHPTIFKCLVAGSFFISTDIYANPRAYDHTAWSFLDVLTTSGGRIVRH